MNNWQTSDQPNKKQQAKNNQIQAPCAGRNIELLIIEPLLKIGNKNKHIIAPAINKIPNNLFVTERKIAYKGKKYHQVQYVPALLKHLLK